MSTTNSAAASNTYFIFSKAISNNVHKGAFAKYLGNKAYSTYTNSGLGIDEFITQMVQNGEIDKQELNEFLFYELFYGMHKHTYIRKIDQFLIDLTNEKNIEMILNNNYGIQDSNYNSICHTTFKISDIKKDGVAAVKIIKDEQERILKIRLIYVEYIQKKYKSGNSYENSYIPIEINLEKNIVITKVAPKTKLVDPTKEPDELEKWSTDQCLRHFGIKKLTFGHGHKEILYNISQKLTDEVISKMSAERMQKISQVVESSAKEILKNIEIANIELRLKENNIFNLNEQMFKLVEHIVIADILYKAKIEKSGLEGIISYIKFRDCGFVNATIKAQKRRDSLFGSDAYFGLRNSINNSKELEKLRAVWYNNLNELLILYDASDINVLFIKFYEKLTEGDFYYGLEKYETFERPADGNVQKVDK